MTNEWVLIEGTENGYEYNNEKDLVRNLKTGQTVKPRINSCGILVYRLRFGGKRHEITAASVRNLRTKHGSRERVCPTCGRHFLAVRVKDKYCCRKCKKATENREYYHIKRAKKYGGAYETGITLPKVIEKYGGICQICGKHVTKANYKDWPTIDHVKALSNGGSHTWDNVQLLCMECNSRKANNEDRTKE